MHVLMNEAIDQIRIPAILCNTFFANCSHFLVNVIKVICVLNSSVLPVHSLHCNSQRDMKTNNQIIRYAPVMHTKPNAVLYFQLFLLPILTSLSPSFLIFHGPPLSLFIELEICIQIKDHYQIGSQM